MTGISDSIEVARTTTPMDQICSPQFSSDVKPSESVLIILRHRDGIEEKDNHSPIC